MYVLFCSLHFHCEKLGKLDVTCGVILDDDGKGTMDVFGHPKAVAFFEESNIAPKFYSYVNARGMFIVIAYCGCNISHIQHLKNCTMPKNSSAQSMGSFQ